MTKSYLQQTLVLLLVLFGSNSLWAQCETGVSITSADGDTRVYTCPGDGQDDIIAFANTSSGTTNFAYVITDDNNVILGVPPGNTQNFEGAGTGVCRVWGFTYTGDILASAGDNVFSTFFSTGCWAISQDFLTVVRSVPDGGTVSTPSGSTDETVCATDGYDDKIIFTHSTMSNAAYQYVITDDQNNILGLPGNVVNFEGVPPGVCRVWGLSYTGNLTASMGDNAATTDLSDGCFDLSDNYISVTRIDVVGGMVATTDGNTSVNTCPGDGNDDIIDFTHTTSSGASYAYIITDDNDVVLGLPPSNSQNFEGAGEGICRIWGISYTGDLTIWPGDVATNKALSTGCFDLSDNFIEVVRGKPDAGTVAMPSGATMRYTCPGDGNDDIVMFTTTSTVMNYQYVITDDNNIILGLPPSNSQNFEGAGEGICRVWGLAYEGTLLAQAGQNAATTELADGCFALSENFITVVRAPAEGGTVAFTDGTTEKNVCTNDGNDDVLEFSHANASAANYRYVVTDDQNNILGLPPGNSVNFEGVFAGTCRVWGLSFTGMLTAQVGDNAAMIDLSNDCFDLSDNFLVVNRSEEDVYGGTVTDANGGTSVTTCPGDGISDVISFAHTTSSGANYAYVITDDQNNILGLPPGNSQDFEGAGSGVCRVWGLSYTGTVIASAGDNATSVALSDGCFELSSNFVEVNRIGADGGMVAMPSGATTRYTCPGDGIDDIVMFMTTSSATNYQYVITDDNNVILGLPPSNSQNFEGAGEGICRVWGLAYSGALLAQPGDNAATTQLADGCFALSSNFITVGRDTPDGGTVAMPSGATTRYTCPGDGLADMVSFVHSGASNSNYAYVITDDQNNILGLPPGNSQDFEGAGEGVCRVWGLAYTGTITAQMGDNAANVALSSECFDLSDNFITINREKPFAGKVSTADGASGAYVCTQDGTPDIVEFSHVDASASRYQYVITDDQNIILGLPPGNSADFDSAPAGNCRVWGFAYTGDLTAQMGDHVFSTLFSTECWAISANFVTIVRDTPDGGTVSTINGQTAVTTIAGDGFDDVINFAHANASNSLYAYVITDDQNNILGIPPGNSQNFEGAGVGTCRVWGLAYTGNIIAGAGDNAAAVALTDDCYSLSSNFVEVDRVAALAGNIVNTKTGVSIGLGGVQDLNLAPNPVYDQLTVSFKVDQSIDELAILKVYNVNGQLLHSEAYQLSPGQHQTQLDLSQLVDGLYFLMIDSDSFQQRERFIKTK